MEHSNEPTVLERLTTLAREARERNNLKMIQGWLDKRHITPRDLYLNGYSPGPHYKDILITLANGREQGELREDATVLDQLSWIKKTRS